jgi:hypothetical protein
MTKPNDHGRTQEDEQTIEALRVGWEQLDRQTPIYTPRQAWFADQIAERKKRNRRLLVRDLTLFGVTAVVVLSALMAAVVKMPAVFLYAQTLSLVIAPLALLSGRRKRVDE